ncbi:MAG: GNAT family N-acetyltransferase [Candidatus Dormibacteraeota bacterium]|nr:GNAT family N-acetyltransferase [Candidatus Dormibacteraeota bacterium]
MTRPTYTIRPLEMATWDAWAALVERNGGVFGGCWCIAFHPEGLAHTTAEANRERKLARVRKGEAHAAVVFQGEEAVGWCQFGSPAELTRIKHRRAYEEQPPPPPDWRITCFYVDKRRRRQGVADAALGGALDLIAAAGGGACEAITEDTSGREVQGRFLFSATLDLFERYGFDRERQVGKHAWIVRKHVAPVA